MDVEIDAQPWRIADLRDGDLVFGQRARGPFAVLCNAADEPWMHVGSLTTDSDGNPAVIELRMHHFLLTSLEEFFSPSRYQVFGAARLDLPRECIEEANRWMKRLLKGGRKSRQEYPWDDYILAGLLAASHRRLVPRCPARVRAAVRAAAANAKPPPACLQPQVSVTCSALIQFGYDQVEGSSGIEHDRWANRAPDWLRQVSSDDALLASADVTGEADAGGRITSSVLEPTAREGIVQYTKLVGTILKDVRPQQWHEIVRVATSGVRGLALGRPSDDGEPAIDNRWVTPGDLWRSPTVTERAYIDLDR